MDDDERKMIRAARMGDLEECQRIFQEKNVNINARDMEKHTALFLAARGRHVPVVTWLLANGADVRIKSDSDQTPLHAVCWNKQADDPRMLEVARLLLDHGQEVDAVNRTGHTPLHWASYYGHVELVRLLIDRGADVTLRNAEGDTPLEKARRRGNSAELRAVISLLEESGGLPVASFYGFLFQREGQEQKKWYDGLVRSIDNVHDTKIFYTILKTSLTLKMISESEAALYLQKAIVQTAKKVTSDESVATYEIFLSKCRKDSILKDDPSFLLLDMTRPNHSPADIRHYVESVVIHSIHNTQDLDMGTNFHDIRQNLQIFCDEMFTLHQYSEKDEDNQAFRVVSALDANYLFRMKAQASVIMVMVLIKALERGVNEALNVMYSEVASRIVDFGDIEHMREIIAKLASAEQSNSAKVQIFQSSLQHGIDLAKKLILETRNGVRKPEDYDPVLSQPDAFLLFGFVSTIINPLSYPPQKKQKKTDEPKSGTSKKKGVSRSVSAEPLHRHSDDMVRRSSSRRKTKSRSRTASSLSPQRFGWRQPLERRPSGSSAARRMSGGSGAGTRSDSPGWSSWRSPFGRARSRSRSRSVDLNGPGSTENRSRRKAASPSPLRFWRGSKSDKSFENQRTPDSRKPAPQSPGRVVTPPVMQRSSNKEDAETPFDESPHPTTAKTFSLSSPEDDIGRAGPVAAAAAAASRTIGNHDDVEANDERDGRPLGKRFSFRGRRERSSSPRRVSRSASPNGRKPAAKTSERDFTPQSHNLKTPKESDLVAVPYEDIDSRSGARSTGSSRRGRSLSRRTNGSRSEEGSKTNDTGTLSASRSSGRLIKVYRDAELSEQDEGSLELHAAVKFGDMELVEEFLSSEDLTDIQLNALDSCGRTALDLAALTGQIEVMTMIESRGGIYSYRPRERMVKKAKKRARYVTQYLKLVGTDL